MAQRKHIFRRGPSSLQTLLVFLVIGLALVLVSLFTDWLQPVRSATLDAVAPFYRVTDVPNRVGDWWQQNYSDREALLSEVKRLQDENLILSSRVNLTADVIAENVHLRQLLNASELVEGRVLIATLVGVPPDAETHRIIIDRGADHGAYTGQPVLDDMGLIGQISSVGLVSSEVMLLSDRAHAVPVKLARNGLRAVAEGSGDYQTLMLRHIPTTFDIKVGDDVVASGLGGKFPHGYPVGKVTDIQVSTASPFMEVRVTPRANLQSARRMLLLFREQFGASALTTGAANGSD